MYETNTLNVYFWLKWIAADKINLLSLQAIRQPAVVQWSTECGPSELVFDILVHVFIRTSRYRGGAIFISRIELASMWSLEQSPRIDFETIINTFNRRSKILAKSLFYTLWLAQRGTSKKYFVVFCFDKLHCYDNGKCLISHLVQTPKIHQRIHTMRILKCLFILRTERIVY